MKAFSRRTFLKLAGGLVVASALPMPNRALGGVLERLFGPESRLTLAITPNDEFYLTSYRSPPTIRIQHWTLAVRGLVDRPLTLTYPELLARPTVSNIVTLECVGNTVGDEYMGTAEWRGIPLDSLLEQVGASPRARDVVFHAADEYSDSITIDRAMAGNVLLAHHMNGVPLPLGHGFPARMIVPGLYGMKSVQWLTRIEVVDYDYKGYYQKKGWTEEAVVKTTSRIDLPGHGDRIRGLQYTIQGLAFAGSRGISGVEVSTDDGATWNPAVLEDLLSPHAWVFWRYDWKIARPGSYSLAVRATDGTGTLQSDFEQGPAPDGAEGLHQIGIDVVGG